MAVSPWPELYPVATAGRKPKHDSAAAWKQHRRKSHHIVPDALNAALRFLEIVNEIALDPAHNHPELAGAFAA